MCESASFFDRFGLKENLIPHHKVRVIIVRQDDSLVGDLVIFLARKRNSSATQFNDESILVDDFVVALSQFAVNFHAQAYPLENFLLVKQLIHLRHELRESEGGTR